MTSIGERLKTIRERRGMTQEDLSALISEKTDRRLSRQTISLWEAGITEPKMSNLIVVAQVLDVPIKELTGDNNIVSEGGTLFRPPYSTIRMYSVPVVPREYLINIDENYQLSEVAVEFITWPQARILAITKDPPYMPPYAIYAEDTDYLTSYNIHRGDKIVVAPRKTYEQGALALVQYYGFPTFRLVYELPGEGTLLQNDTVEILLTPEQIMASGYKFLGLVAGTVCNRPTPRPLIRRGQ